MDDLLPPPSRHQRTSSSEFQSRPLGRTSLGIREQRPASTFSMYNGRAKILPTKPVTGFLKSAEVSRRSESSHGHKTIQHKSLIREQRLDVTANANDASFSSLLNPLKQFKRQGLRNKVRAALTTSDYKLKNYFQLVQKSENEFINHCRESRHRGQSGKDIVIIRLLNYSVDFNLPQQFLRTLKLLSDFYLHTDNVNLALFYYEQTRQASLLLDHPVLLIECLLGLAQCSRKVGVEGDGIKILKKALEYSWFRGLQEQQLRIFDEIGKMYYSLGDLHKARQYHARHVNALHQAPSSALRQLSKQRIIKNQQANLQIRYKQINRLLLVHLKVPIRTLEQFPLPFRQFADQPIRMHFDFTNKYFGGDQATSQIKKILGGWFFQEEIEEPHLPEEEYILNRPKNKKYAFLDFQLNQQLKKLQSNTAKYQKKKLMRKSYFPVKQSLQQQVTRKMKQPPLEADWYQKIVKQINRDHKNKLLNIRSAVRIRGFNKKTIPSIDILKDMYNELFQRSKYFAATPLIHNASTMSKNSLIQRQFS